MRKIKLDEELQEYKEHNIKEQTEAVKNVRLLLESHTQEDNRIINLIGANSTLAKQQQELGRVMELEKMENEYGKVFHINEIQNLAIEYKLRFLPSSQFTGNMDVQVVSKVKEFVGEAATRKTVVGLDDHVLKNQFYILAIASQFNLRQGRRRPPSIPKIVDRDPVLFYKIDEDHYRMIHKWGTDFTIFRRITGWIWQNSANHTFFTSLWLFMISSILLLIVAACITELTVLHTIMPLLLSSGSTTFLVSRYHNKTKDYLDASTGTNHLVSRYSEKNWRSIFRA